MFKENYKLDNDRITPSNELLDSLKQKMQDAKDKEQEENQKTFLSVTKKFKSVAAVLLLFLLSFSTYELAKQNGLFHNSKDAADSQNINMAMKDSKSYTSSDTTENEDTYDEGTSSKESTASSSDKSSNNNGKENKSTKTDSSDSSTDSNNPTTAGDSTNASSEDGADNSAFGIASSSTTDESVTNEEKDTVDSSQDDYSSIAVNPDTDNTDEGYSITNDSDSSNSLLAAPSSSFININEADVNTISVVYTGSKSENEISNRSDISAIVANLQSIELSEKADESDLDSTTTLTLILHLADNTLNEIVVRDSAVKVDGIWYNVSDKLIQTLQNSVEAATK